MKPVVLRPLARQDVADALAYYIQSAGPDVAVEFVDALEMAIDHIANHPAGGSPRYAHELGLPGLRNWSLRAYPYLIF